MTEADEDLPEPYRSVGEKAHFLKAVVQMAIGSVGLVATFVWLLFGLLVKHVDVVAAGRTLFAGVGLTLAAATAVELTYTLFTHGPDEAIDPILLGLAAALLIQLGQVSSFRLSEAAAAVLYVLALAGLLLIKKRLVEGETREDWVPGWWSGLWSRRRVFGPAGDAGPSGDASSVGGAVPAQAHPE
jgi:hypothetical protein